MAVCCFYWPIYWLSTDLRLKWPKPQSREVCWRSSWISGLCSGGWTGVISLRSPALLSVFQDGLGPVQTGPAGGRQGQGGFSALSVCLFDHLSVSCLLSVCRRGDRSWPQSVVTFLKLRNGEDKCVSCSHTCACFCSHTHTSWTHQEHEHTKLMNWLLANSQMLHSYRCVCVCVFQIISEISKKVAQIQNGERWYPPLSDFSCDRHF